jgi:dolichol-phosphate mannosyltransferase
MSRRVVQEVVRLKESHGFLRGMVAVVGFKQAIIPFDRPARFAGETNYNRFFGSLRIGFNGIFCFSTYALSLSTWLGFVVSGFSFLLMAVYLFYKLIGWDIKWGNPTLVMLISFLGGIQLISVGILGEYIGRIYEEVRARPKFIVDRAEGFNR